MMADIVEGDPSSSNPRAQPGCRMMGQRGTVERSEGGGFHWLSCLVELVLSCADLLGDTYLKKTPLPSVSRTHALGRARLKHHGIPNGHSPKMNGHSLSSNGYSQRTKAKNKLTEILLQ